MGTNLTFFEVAAGCGGMSLGLRQAGLECIGALDFDPQAAAVHRANSTAPFFQRSLEGFKWRGKRFDLLVGGLPCEGFSTLGKMNHNYRGNKLWWHFANVLEAVRPKAFLVENVPPFMESARASRLAAKAERLGYQVETRILDAVDYGVPQRRRRAIMIGTRGSFSFPRRSSSRMTVRDAFSGLASTPDGANDHLPRMARPTSQKSYPFIPPGGDRRDLPKQLQNKCWRDIADGAAYGVFGRLEWSKPADTIRTTFLKPECGRYIHPCQHRGLTVREGARLQGFPDSFTFSPPGKNLSMDSKARLIGRAVPPPLARSIGRALARSV